MIAVEQNWPNWLFIVSSILLMKGILERWYRGQRADQKHVHSFFEKTSDALATFGKTIVENQKLILATVKDTRRANDDIVINAIREMGNASNTSTGNILIALGRREQRTVEAIETLARAIRDDLAALRSPPPVGGTGSQVRDGGTP